MSIFDTSGVVKKPKLNKFFLDKEVLMTGNIGPIYPVYCKWLVPGDFFSVSPNCVIKTTPMFNPIYSSQKVDFHVFAVPFRLLWSYFDKWRFDPENVEHSMPHISLGFFNQLLASGRNDLTHNLGLPYLENPPAPDDIKERPVNIMDFLAYRRIVQDYFTNMDLQDDFFEKYSVTPDMEDYDQVDSDFFELLSYRLYKRDYFTSALPFPQRGSSPSIASLITGQAPINVEVLRGEGDAPESEPQTDHLYRLGFVGGYSNFTPTDNDNFHLDVFGLSGDDNYATQYAARVYADLTSAQSGVSVSDLRVLFCLDKFQEISALAGTRIVEGTLAYYGVRVPDHRAQMPEFLGMCSTNIVSSEITANTAASNQVMGKRAGVGNAAAFGKQFRYFAYEHCVLMIVMSVRPTSYYFQGVPRHFGYIDQFDIPTPLFQHLGEQPVYNSEIFYDGYQLNHEGDYFGYQSRYADVRSEIHEIRGDFARSLTTFHLGRKFTKRPELDEEFVTVQNPAALQHDLYIDLNSVYNYKDGDHLWISLYFRVKSKRPFKYHTQPMLIG